VGSGGRAIWEENGGVVQRKVVVDEEAEHPRVPFHIGGRPATFEFGSDAR
jgi:hypothetical protein